MKYAFVRIVRTVYVSAEHIRNRTVKLTFRRKYILRKRQQNVRIRFNEMKTRKTYIRRQRVLFPVAHYYRRDETEVY